MTLPSRSVDPEILARIRGRIAAANRDPATTPEDFSQLVDEAREANETGHVSRRASSLRVRMFGLGVPDHDVSVHHAAQLLDLLQGAVTATGEAVRGSGALPANSADAQRSTSEATELFLSPSLGTGSVVFFLQARERPRPDPVAVEAGVEGLIDVASRRLFQLLDLAASEDVSERSDLEESMRTLGARAASKIASLAEASLKHEIEMDIALRTPIGRRTGGVLSRRTSVALQNAFSQASDRVERHEFVGTLKTASDGTDLLRLQLDGSTKNIRLSVEPQLGARLGQFLGQRIRADAEVNIKWAAATGKESRRYRLLSAVSAPPATQQEIPGEAPSEVAG